MNSYISLLRGINVSGHNKIKMNDLKSLYESLGFSNVKTYIQSGNVIFESEKKDKENIEDRIKAEIKRVFGYDITLILRASEEFKKTLENNPFVVENKDPSTLYVTFLNEIPPKQLVEKLDISIGSDDQFIIKDREIYIYCHNGYGRTKINNNFFERRLNVAATTRNWETVTTLYKMSI